MYARLTSIDVPESSEEFALPEIVEQVLPTLRELDGFRGLVVLSEVQGPRIVALSLWASAEALQASEDIAAKLRAAETTSRGIEPPDAAAFRVDALRLNP